MILRCETVGPKFIVQGIRLKHTLRIHRISCSASHHTLVAFIFNPNFLYGFFFFGPRISNFLPHPLPCPQPKKHVFVTSLRLIIFPTEIPNSTFFIYKDICPRTPRTPSLGINQVLHKWPGVSPSCTLRLVPFYLRAYLLFFRNEGMRGAPG